MVPLPFAASAFCFGSVPKAGRSGYLIYKVSTLRNVRSAAPKEQQGFATTITHRCASVRLRHMLALPAKLREIDTDDVYAVKRLLAVFIPDLLEVGRELIHQQMQRTHHLFFGEMDMRLTPQDDALILCGEVAWQQMHASNDAERHNGCRWSGRRPIHSSVAHHTPIRRHPASTAHHIHSLAKALRPSPRPSACHGDGRCR